MQPRSIAVVLVACSLTLASCGGGTPKSHGDSPASSGVAGFAERVVTARKQARALAGRAPGVLLSVRDGNDRKVLATGDAARDPERKLTPEDTVMIASVTKALVATAALSLVQDGSLRLDDSVEKWLPGLLPRQPLAFAPGSQGEQSNTNYAVLQLVLERARRASLDELLGRRVLEPAGLAHTTLGGTPTALGYDGDQDVTIRDPENPSAAAGAVSSVDDIERFLDSLTAGKLLDAENTKAMQNVHAHADGEDYRLGLLVHHQFSCGTAVGQVGENRGYVMDAWTLPDKQRTVVVAATSGAAGPEADRVAEVALCA